jgi:hypothetical protein
MGLGDRVGFSGWLREDGLVEGVRRSLRVRSSSPKWSNHTTMGLKL